MNKGKGNMHTDYLVKGCQCLKWTENKGQVLVLSKQIKSFGN